MHSNPIKVCLIVVAVQMISLGISFFDPLSPNPLLMYSANVKDSENADR